MAISKIDPAGLDVGQIGGRRNLIINGAMQVAQRGTSFTGVTGSSYHLDRFKWETNTEDTATIEQSTDSPDGFATSYKLTITTAESTIDNSEYASISQYMEGLNVQQLKYGTSSAEQITCSFWVKCSETGTATVALYQDDANQYISQPYTVDSADTWEYKTLTFVGNTATAINNDNTIGLRLQFNVAGGSNYTGGSSNVWGTSANFQSGQTINLIETVNSTFQITGVQLEVGSVATPFEHRSYGEELALCQRYYTVIFDPDIGTSYGFMYPIIPSSSTYRRLNVTFPVAMRAPPNIDVIACSKNGGTFAGGHPTSESASTTQMGIMADLTSASSTIYVWCTKLTVEAEL